MKQYEVTYRPFDTSSITATVIIMARSEEDCEKKFNEIHGWQGWQFVSCREGMF